MDKRKIFSSANFKKLLILAFFTIDITSGKSHWALKQNRRHLNSYIQQPPPLSRSKSFHGTPIWNRHYIPVKEQSEHNQGGWGYAPHEVQTHHSHTEEHRTQGLKKVLNELIGTMGPFLFPLPYFLAMIPFTIPAIPLALWFDRTNGESPHKPENSHQPQKTTTEHPTEPTRIPSTSIPTTLKPLTTSTTPLTTTRSTTTTLSTTTTILPVTTKTPFTTTPFPTPTTRLTTPTTRLTTPTTRLTTPTTRLTTPTTPTPTMTTTNLPATTTPRKPTDSPTTQSTTTTTRNPPTMTSSNFTIISNDTSNPAGGPPFGSNTNNNTLDPVGGPPFGGNQNNNTLDPVGGPPSIDYPQTPPLFPFPLFLNSSWLSVDYNNGDQYWDH